MNTIRAIVGLSVAALLAACASPGANPNAGSPAGMAPMNTAAAGPMAAMDPRMKAMQDMHQKMVNAGTPAERQALMADHMKAMQGGMAMMKEMNAMPAGGGMGGMGMPADMSKRHSMMAEHMAMMQMMMDMMADRMPPASMGK